MRELSKIKASDDEQLVIYDNKINAQMTGLKAKDYDLFMVCAYKLKDMANQSIEVGYREIKELMQTKRHMSFQELHQYLKDEESISDIKFTFIDEDGDIHKRPLFKAFDTKWRNKKLVLKVNDEFADYFSNLQKNFTELDLIIYTSLKSKYSKILYQNLCQYRNKHGKGWWDIPLEDNVRDTQPIGFKTLFEVPQTYKNKEILKEIIKPSMVELAPYMAIEVTSVRGTGRGKPLIGYHFDFESVPTAIKDKKQTPTKPTDAAPPMSPKEQSAVTIEDTLADTIEQSGLAIGLRSATSIIKTCIKYKRDAIFLTEAIELVKQQGADDVGAKLNYFCQHGFEKPVKKVKKNSFNDFTQRDYDDDYYEDLERRIVQKNLQELEKEKRLELERLERTKRAKSKNP